MGGRPDLSLREHVSAAPIPYRTTRTRIGEAGPMRTPVFHAINDCAGLETTAAVMAILLSGAANRLDAGPSARGRLESRGVTCNMSVTGPDALSSGAAGYAAGFAGT